MSLGTVDRKKSTTTIETNPHALKGADKIVSHDLFNRLCIDLLHCQILSAKSLEASSVSVDKCFSGHCLASCCHNSESIAVHFCSEKGVLLQTHEHAKTRQLGLQHGDLQPLICKEWPCLGPKNYGCLKCEGKGWPRRTSSKKGVSGTCADSFVELTLVSCTCNAPWTFTHGCYGVCGDCSHCFETCLHDILTYGRQPKVDFTAACNIKTSWRVCPKTLKQQFNAKVKLKASYSCHHLQTPRKISQTRNKPKTECKSKLNLQI